LNTHLKGLAATACIQFALTPGSWAVEFNTGNPDVTARWDNTVKYNGAWRLRGQSEALLVDANMDDGDRNFNKGLVSNRVDLLSEFDLAYQKRMGLRISGAAWYDTVYNTSNDNTSPATANQLSVPGREFTRATRNLHGRDAELLDAFVYGQFNLGTMPANLRLGKHTVLSTAKPCFSAATG